MAGLSSLDAVHSLQEERVCAAAPGVFDPLIPVTSEQREGETKTRYWLLLRSGHHT